VRTDPASSPSSIDQGELRVLLTHLSHELCRPLISLRAGFDLILEDASRPVSHDQRGHLQTMVDICDDLLRLTRSYLDYAGLVRGARPLCDGSYTISALIGEIDRQFAQEAASCRLGWECGLDGSDASVVIDATRCQQVLSNLVTNALKYTSEGGRVTVTARQDGAQWLVTVADTGAGIPVEAQSRVFEPFYRLPRDERSGVEGNGLGLAICRELVDQMGGKITISSVLGQGTRVLVVFPTRPAIGVRNDPPAPPPRA
jgi:signal transduction histidine kinase